MKKFVYIYILFVLFSSCTGDLEQSNPNVITEDNFWETEDDVLSGLAAAYNVLRDVDNGYWGVRGVELMNGRGDDFYIRNDVRPLYQLSTFTNDATTGTPSSIFTGFYNGIFRANQIIKNTPEIGSISEEKKKELIAEASFLRALNYFHLTINFGSVPVITTVPEMREDYFVEKSSEAEVWSQVEKDLMVAKENLPESYPDEWVGRATRGAAIGYLGKAYLYQEKWSEAEAEFSILSEPDGSPKAPFNYDLLENYGDNFIAEMDNNKESLFEIQIQNVGGADPFGENADESLGVSTAQEFAPPEVGGWFEAFPTNKIFNEFQEEKTINDDFDPRMYASLIWDYPGATFYNMPFSEFELQFGFNSLIKKYQNYMDDNEGIFISEINEKALRYADILLMYAEALTMQGKVSQAYPLVNRIRNRAELTELAQGLNESEMMAEIRHQRMIEFFREGYRFYDLKRWGLLEEEIEDSDKVGREFFNLSRHEYFPIPQDELNTNPNLEQNPGW